MIPDEIKLYASGQITNVAFEGVTDTSIEMIGFPSSMSSSEQARYVMAHHVEFIGKDGDAKLVFEELRSTPFPGEPGGRAGNDVFIAPREGGWSPASRQGQYPKTSAPPGCARPRTDPT